MNIEQKISLFLTKQKQTLAVAESCSGGFLGHRLTNIAGSSNYFIGGVLVYANRAKTKLLGISPALLKKHGAVSQPVAQDMAAAVRKVLKTDFGISITGIAGPAGGTIQKPVGLVFIAVANSKKITCKKFYFKGSRQKIKTAATDSALKLLLNFMNKN
ncbi:MAG: CinA family protein [Candidatus Omnitrophica bacterium]|nr:CinA family protein [Candidatus Omnitrophota bacterium]